MITSEIKKSRVLRKITLGASVAIMAVGLVTTASNKSLAETESSGGGEGYSCTVTTACDNGSISCTGSSSCSRTTTSVKCDGHTTRC